MTNQTAAPGWYPDHDDELLLRRWDGERWTDERKGRWPVAYAPTPEYGLFDPATRNGRLSLWTLRHPLGSAGVLFVCGLPVVVLGMALLKATVDHQPVDLVGTLGSTVPGAVSMTVIVAVSRSRARRRLREEHERFWTARRDGEGP